MALVPAVNPVEMEASLARQLKSVQAQAVSMAQKLKNGQPTEEQNQCLAVLMDQLKQIEGQQKALHKAVVEEPTKAKTAKEAIEKERAFLYKTPEPAPVRMEDRRAAGRIELDADDVKQRKAEIKVKVTASGGLTAFRVAPDLTKIDFSSQAVEEEEEGLK
ncbi:hypothetical protein WJX72_011345 [[Myrmecia] bisecta]|uniref:Uncharacterized protein n=1 Tax=[Myrmecia] bisecta TaxID=41462 RepID=A0AAW1R993_9CHLO